MASGNIKIHMDKCLYREENKRECLECSLRIYDLDKIKFCSRSCAATHNNRLHVKRKKQVATVEFFQCLFCEIECTRRKNSLAKFCSVKCQMAARQDEVFKKIEDGNYTGLGRNSFKAYLVEKISPNCAECGQEPFWNGKKLTLDMDHIDGDRGNNVIENLRLLCPNCHTQTETWGRKTRNIKE
jgi:hypothetical protein